MTLEIRGQDIQPDFDRYEAMLPKTITQITTFIKNLQDVYQDGMDNAERYGEETEYLVNQAKHETSASILAFIRGELDKPV